MGYRSVLGWAIAAALLGGLVWLAPGLSSGNAPAARTVAIDPASVQSIEIRRGDERFVTFVRGGELGGVWNATWDGTAGEVHWLADAAAVRAAVSLVRTSPLGLRTGATENDLSGLVTEVEFVSDAGAVQTSQRLRLAADAIAGQTAAELGGAGFDRRVPVWAGADLTRVWVDRPLSGWLDGGVMGRLLTQPGAGGPSRMSIAASGLSTTLVRGRSGWRIENPVIARADADKVEQTITLLARVGASELAWEEVAPVGEPIAEIRVSSGDDAPTPWSIVLRVLGAGSVDKSSVEAVVSAEIAGQRYGPLRASVRAEPLTAITPAAWDYFPKRSASFGRAEVVGLQLRGAAGKVIRSATRSVDGWESESRGDATLAASTVVLLTQTEATRVTLLDEEAQSRPGVTVTLLGRREIELGSWRLEPLADGSGIACLERLPGGGVIERVYEGPATTDISRWLRDAITLGGL